jgi:hypothetical protein
MVSIYHQAHGRREVGLEYEDRSVAASRSRKPSFFAAASRALLSPSSLRTAATKDVRDGFIEALVQAGVTATGASAETMAQGAGSAASPAATERSTAASPLAALHSLSLLTENPQLKLWVKRGFAAGTVWVDPQLKLWVKLLSLPLRSLL